ncbi:hypothetical protein AYI70_g5813 [Smittium culicis]|uniref:Uncharacterized protein n=1 Tax=Smittium culicis TaxID=133412 RepID=A0A1R1XSU2_9FUNG|nr:hypothetical protein AYI70_g5813 [Smittium culicis]
MDLITFSAIEKRPKSRALGSKIASKSVASYEDVISLGFWSTEVMKTYYYCLKSKLQLFSVTRNPNGSLKLITKAATTAESNSRNRKSTASQDFAEGMTAVGGGLSRD